MRETAWRTLGERPYDEQMLAGIALRRGQVVEMQTGEGKILAAVAPVALNALAGPRLPRADLQRLPGAPGRRLDGAGLRAARALGRLRPGGPDPGGAAAGLRLQRTYLTVKEAGFDFLRDGLCLERGLRPRRG